MEKIAIGADHAGVQLKDQLASALRSWGYGVSDMGTNSADSVDYPDYAAKVALALKNQECDKGVLVCGSGIGVCITANRFSNVRAVVLRSPFDAEMSRLHNNANVACFGARITETEAALGLLKSWLETQFEGGRHERRVQKIESVKND